MTQKDIEAIARMMVRKPPVEIENENLFYFYNLLVRFLSTLLQTGRTNTRRDYGDFIAAQRRRRFS